MLFMRPLLVADGNRASGWDWRLVPQGTLALDFADGDLEKLKAAFVKARQARFEFGEQGI
jgi:hypothetical protein